MATLDVDPVADARNEGWSLDGLLGTLWEAFSNLLDSNYGKSPNNKGRAAVSFPVDISTIPDGAIITSVSIYIRTRKDSSDNHSVTLNILSSDDPSKFTSRTLYPTTSFADYEIGSYTRDPLGYAWDIERLNKMMVQMFSYSGVTNAIHVSRVWASINYRVRPNVNMIGPTGNLATASPTVSWTYTQADGDVQAKAQYKVFSAADVAGVAFNPDKSVPAHSGEVLGDRTSFVFPFTLESGSYYTYVQVESGVGALSGWSGKPFSVEAPHPGAPTVSATGNSADSKAVLTIQDTSNLLSAVQADAEVSADRDEYTITNGTFSRTSAQVFGTGTASYSMSSSGTSSMYIESDYFRIAPSKAVTIRAQALTAVSARTNVLTLNFYDEDFASTGSAVTVSSTDSTSWSEIKTNGTTASGAVYAKLKYQITSPGGASEVHYVDHLGVMYGTDSSWTPGGHTSRNLASSDLGGSPDDDTWSASAGTTISTITNESRTGASGWRAMNLTRVNPSTSISYVSTGTVYNSTSSSSSITLNKPGSIAAGDLLVAYIVTDKLGSVTPPTGWENVDVAQVDDGGTHLSLHVLSRTAGGADPSSWTASTSLPASRISARVVAYRGAEAASTNLLDSAVSTQTTDTALSIRSATLNNSTSNAWRLSAFAVRDDVDGSWTGALYGSGGTTATISCAGVSAPWSQVTDGSSFTIYKPSNVTTGDVMIATCSWWDDQQTLASFNAPSGWTVVDSRMSRTGVNGFFVWDYQCVTVTMWKTATGSEPTSYSASLSGTRKIRVTQAVAYRGVNGTTPFIAEDGSGISSSTHSLNTPTVTNTHASAWSVCCFTAHGYSDISNGNNWTSTENVKRAEMVAVDSGVVPDGHTIAFFDSNGVIATGGRSRSATIPGTHTVDGATAWIGILNPATTPYVPGTSQTERCDDTAGTSSLYLNWGAYDSNTTISSGEASVLGTYAPGSGSTVTQMVGWHGILIPAAPTVAGLIQVTTSDYIDISEVSEAVKNSAGNKMVLGAAFIGNVPGTPALSLQFYRANQLLEAPILEGEGFGDSVWNYTARAFTIPEGATRVKARLAVTGRANSDTVDVDRVTIAFGDDINIWKNGTTLGLHPIWNVPIVEYQDDDGTGFGSWYPVAGVGWNPPRYDYLTGEATFEDHTLIPLTTRQYRVRTYTHGLRGDGSTSVYSYASGSVNISGTYWWLKDLENPEDSIILPVMSTDIQTSTSNTASAFQPLGESHPIVITEGFKTDVLELPLIAQRTDWVAFRKMVKSGKSLFLQSDIDDAWWVRPISDLTAETLVSAQRQSDPYRVVKVKFIQVRPEA